MANYHEKIDALRDARKQRDKAKDDLYAARIRNVELLRAKKKDNEGTAPAFTDTGFTVTHDTNLPNINDENEKEQIYRRASLNVSSLVADLFVDMSPQSLIEEWSDDYPIMLMPVRLETKFKTEPPLNQLWVRVFPDEIAIVTHEKTLTKKEHAQGKTYWAELFKAEANDTKKKEAWRKLAEFSGANRAAWVAKQTKPANWNNRLSLANEGGLQFPEYDLLKPDAWTEAPHSRIMPDRFVLMAFDAKGDLLHTQTGNQVKDILITGPAPVENNTKPSLSRDENTKQINFGEDYVWVKDFQKAVDEGLGFKVDLNEATQNGFSRLVVIGLKHSADEADGKVLIEDLIDNHHYSRKGFSIVRQGSPTNNTEEEDAAFNSKDPMHDLSYWVETGDPLFVHRDKKFEITDGQRLAEFLGIEYTPLQYIANSNLKENAQAVAMNAALCAGTLDYFLNRMLNGVFSDTTNQQIRDHFVNHVTGRGALPAIRIGKQPYGILVTSSFDDWKYASQRPIRGALFSGHDILPPLLDVLRYFSAKWKERVPGIAVIGKGGNAGSALMSILGLQPTSVEYFQRVAFSRDDVENKGLLMNDKYFQDVMDVSFQSSVARAIMKDLGYSEKEANGTPKPLPMLLQLFYQRYHTRLDKLNLIDGQPLSEERKIKPYNKAGTQNYVHWLIANAADHGRLESLDFGGVPAPNALLFLMLHFSLLMETGKSISNYLQLHDIAATELTRSRKMMNMSSAPSVSPWEIFRTPVNLLIKEETEATPLFTHIHSSKFRRSEFTGVVSNLTEQKEALEVLKNMSTAALERVFAEHIDTLSYRIDSWQQSLISRRLMVKRNIPGDPDRRQKGVYIGAYGYLENIAPANKRERITEDGLPRNLREGKDNLYREAGNGGYVHAPSMNHATAAAILRNGYLSYSNKDEKELLSVNLSSERVRRAMYLIEGVRNGQTVEVLLGYQFERGFHDFSTRSPSPVILNHLIPFFRNQFPVKKTKLPQQGNVTGPEEVIDDFHVVNGLSVVKSADNFPEGIAGLPSLNAEQISSIRAVKNNLANTLDAFHDVLVSESAYQLALGNFDRAAAVVQAVSNSNILPEIEVIHTPRGSDLAFTNRFVVHFSTASVATPWNTIPMTLRASTEPAVNAWLGSLIGDPSKIRCKVMVVDKEGQVLTSATGNVEDTVSLAELGIQPIDLVYIINKQHESGFAEIEMRIRHQFLQKQGLGDAEITSINFGASSLGAPVPGMKSFAEVLPLCYYLRELLTSSRPLLARDYQSQSKKLTTPPPDPDNINVTELVNRVKNVFNAIDALVPLLDTAIADAKNLKTLAALNILRLRLLALSNSGIMDAFPNSSVSINDLLTEALIAQGESVSKRFVEFKQAFTEKMAQVNDTATAPAQKLELLQEIARALFGGDFRLLPKFSLLNVTDVTNAFQHKNEILDHSTNVLNIPLPVEEWLHGASLVRKKLRNFELIRIINDTTNATAFDYAPIQIPYRKKDNWLAVEFPRGTEIFDDTISIVQYLPQGFDPAGNLSGLVVDEWTEFIPKNHETTGISFNYNQPNSCPPQSILLAVAPEEGKNWKWDHLVATVLDTFSRAKLRAVEPDEVDKIPGITTLVPAIVSEFSTGANNVSLDYSFNIKEVYIQATAAKITQ